MRGIDGSLQYDNMHHLLCAHLLSGAADCGPECTADGMHFVNATYDALVQQWANGVRLMWRAAYCSSRTQRRTLRRRANTPGGASGTAGLCESPGVEQLTAERV